MYNGTLFVRVVPQDRDRGYMLLSGFDSKIVQATCREYTTLSAPSREGLNAIIARMLAQSGAADVKDVTAPNIQKKLAVLFGEA
jgi:hypothetical protein